ncbi:MAG TPA: chromate efflux transporter [Actinomycetota bacterium]|nr:chromate efflux transporter [Actinomycetota bacterium]
MRRPEVPFREALRFWVKLGFVNFGGPTGQIAIMHHELVEKRRWMEEDRFLHALNFCTLLPGPEAQQLAIYVGWLLHRARGGIVAGIAFVLPAMYLMLGLAWLYAVHGELSWVAAVFDGLGAAVVGIVGAAVIRIGARTLSSGAMVAVAAASFAGLFLYRLPFPAVILAAGALGFAGGHLRPDVFSTIRDQSDSSENLDEEVAMHTRPSLGRSVRVLGIGLAVWWAPLVLVALLRGPGDVLTDEALFFSKAAVVTFGGAYAVLAYIDRAAVGYGWLTPGEMVTGLGLAESTPGPLIMVTQFVGFVAAYRSPGGLDPLVAGVIGALVTVWATFAPSFLWVFLGAPYVERLRGNVRLRGTLATITAAVVGVVLSLAVSFALRVLFEDVRVFHLLGATIPVPTPSSLDPFATAVALIAFLGIWRSRWNVVPVVIASAAAGWLRSLIS